MISEQETKLYVALGAAFTLFVIFLLQAWQDPSALNQTSVYILLFILTGAAGIDAFRNNPPPGPDP